MGLTRISTKDVPLPSRINRDASGISSDRVDAARGSDPGSERHLLEIHPEAGMALLPARLAVPAVVDADDGQIGRIQHRDSCERPDVHEELAVTGHDEHPAIRTGQGEPEPH